MQQPLRRSLSFTDAHFIAQAVYEGDTKLIEELYPDFPRSEPIYAVVDKKTKKQQVLSPVEELAGSSNSSERSPQKSPAQIQNHQRTNLQTAKDVKDVEDNPLQKEVTVASSSVMFVNSSPKNGKKNQIFFRFVSFGVCFGYFWVWRNLFLKNMIYSNSEIF